MAFEKDNSWWKARSEHGRDKIFSSPDILLEEAEKYFEWCDEHPLEEQKVFGTGVTMTEKHMRAYTLQALCLFLDIAFSTWCDYRKRPDFKDVIEKIEMCIYNQKFVGAASNFFNANIISRDLGLIDKQEHTLQPKDKDLSHLSDEDLQLYYELTKKIENGQQRIEGALLAPQIQIHNGNERPQPLEARTGIKSVNGQ